MTEIEIRCKKCNALLLKANTVFGTIVCRKCGHLQQIKLKDGKFVKK